MVTILTFPIYRSSSLCGSLSCELANILPMYARWLEQFTASSFTLLSIISAVPLALYSVLVHRTRYLIL